MAAKCIRDKDATLREMDVLMKPYEIPVNSFTIRDMTERYGLTPSRAYKVVRKLIDAGQVVKVSKDCYVTSPGLSVSSARAAASESRPTRRTKKK